MYKKRERERDFLFSISIFLHSFFASIPRSVNSNGHNGRQAAACPLIRSDGDLFDRSCMEEVREERKAKRIYAEMEVLCPRNLLYLLFLSVSFALHVRYLCQGSSCGMSSEETDGRTDRLAGTGRNGN
mmetsp:Transcript_43153/g.85072  ORF Transcript_43153/g.85072 Transcript_43153/m.85072 type:complete len:128 (-) Transcript_43153:1146-1529(-)